MERLTVVFPQLAVTLRREIEGVPSMESLAFRVLRRGLLMEESLKIYII
jgi:hypothetical protein